MPFVAVTLEGRLGLFLALLPVLAPPFLGLVLGYVFPAARPIALTLPGFVLILALYVSSFWFASAGDLDRAGRVVVMTVFSLFMLMLWVTGVLSGQWLRRRLRT